MNSLEEIVQSRIVQYRGDAGKKKQYEGDAGNERSKIGGVQLGANQTEGNVARRGTAWG